MDIIDIRKALMKQAVATSYGPYLPPHFVYPSYQRNDPSVAKCIKFVSNFLMLNWLK